MCKPVTITIKDQILQNLSCRFNGVTSNMDLCPPGGHSLSSNLINNIDFKVEKSEVVANEHHYEEVKKEPSESWRSQEESETYQSLQEARLDNLKNNEVFSMFEDISTYGNAISLKSSSLEENLIKSMRPDNKAIVDDLIEKIGQLSIIQKMLLYLKLPAPSEDLEQLDPLRRPLNPLGNRYEVSQALAYIRTHFQPDPDVSLPKKEIYNEYVSYCSNQKMKPLSTADFGKAMKQVYPVVRPRRLGERGNSRYCYSGLSNRSELEKPRTPASALARDSVSRKICSWASKVLNVKVNNLTELSTIIGSESVPNSTDESGNLQQTDSPTTLKEKKRKIEFENAQNEETRSIKQRKTSDIKIEGQRTYDLKSPKPLVSTSSAQNLRGEAKAVAFAGLSNICDNSNQKQIDVNILNIKHLVDNNLDLKPDKSTNLGKKKRPLTSKRSVVKKPLRITQKTEDLNKKISSKKETIDLLPIENGFTIASIEEDFSSEPNDNLKSKCTPTNSHAMNEAVITEGNSCDLKNFKMYNETYKTQECGQNDSYNDTGYLSTESLGQFLEDEGNSQEPEEELLKYFKDPIRSEPNNYSLKDTSQLRLLLEQNMSEELGLNYDGKISERDTGFCEDESIKLKEMNFKNSDVSPQESPRKSSFLPNIPNSSNKRRVSFENIPDSFPESPITCTKNFSFTPISPRPPTISKSMVNVSPFVFPRETVFRGKLANTGNHQTPIPSPVSRSHISPHKGSLRSTSLSSTPSPVTSGRSSSSAAIKGRCTPQDIIPEHSDSLKSSPLISPSSSSGVFLSPASPMSSCNSPIFIFRKNMSPIKQDESKSSTKSNSLLQSLLLTGKCPEKKSSNIDSRFDSNFDTINKEIEPLAVDVQFQFSIGQNLLSCRSQSVPTLTSNPIVSPSSNTLPFSDSAFNEKDTPSLLDIKPNELDVLDTVIKNSEENLLIENLSDNDTLESGIHTVGNDVSMESVISNLYDFLNDKDLSGPSDQTKVIQVSRSQPNTPIYSDTSNSSRDPVVSAFAISSISKSYPSTPTVNVPQSLNGVKGNINFSTKRNINPLLDSLSNPVSSLSDDIDLHLNNFAELSACDDAFNQLAKEVAGSNTSDKDLQ